MVARIHSGKDLRGVLSYNEHKVKEGTAECLLASSFHGRPNEMNFYDKYERFRYFTDRNTKVKTNAIHISLNFDVGEQLDKDKLCNIANTYMDRIGFGDQPYLVYEHTDAAHPHIHIITTNVKLDGKRIDIHNIGKDLSEKARKAIEDRFNLVKAESKEKKQEIEFLRPIDLKKAIYGKAETKRSISNIVSTIVMNYKYTSIPELNAVLNQYNIKADRGKEGSAMHEKKGLQYCMIDEKGNKVGIPIKASTIYGKPTMSFLENQFQLNTALRRPHKESLRQVIDLIFRSGARNGAQFQKQLKSRNIEMILRSSSEGRVYGITYVDHNTRCVFNGSDLGKAYTAKGIADRLEQNERAQPFRPGYSKIESTQYPSEKATTNERSDKQIDKFFSDLIKTESQEYVSPEAAMRLRKKKRRKRGLSP